jgi:hypothetical protein
LIFATHPYRLFENSRVDKLRREMSDPIATRIACQRPAHGRWAKSAIIRILAVIGALWVGFHGLAWVARATRPYWSSDRPAAIFPSPDGRFKAVVFLSMGGGPATSYCGESVYVVPASYAAAETGGTRDLVYSAACGGMSEGHWEKNVIWRSPRLLEIGFNPTAGAAGGTVEIRGAPDRGQVQIKFSFQSQEDAW